MPRTPGPPRSSARARAIERAQVGALPRGRVHRLRERQLRRRSVLLPRRPARLPRPVLLRRHGAPARRARRLRLGLRDRARGGPPRAEPDRHEPRGAPAPERESRRGQRPVGAPRAAGRLLRRRLGQHGLRGRRPPARRRAGGHHGVGVGGRRPAPVARRRLRRTPTPSRTEAPSSGRAGSTPGARAASPAPATPSPSTSSRAGCPSARCAGTPVRSGARGAPACSGRRRRSRSAGSSRPPTRSCPPATRRSSRVPCASPARIAARSARRWSSR